MVKFWSKSGTTEIIEYLSGCKEDCLTGVMDKTGLNSYTAMSAVSHLLSDGIIEERRGKYNTRYLKLTEKGIKISKYIVKINELVEG